MPEIIIIMKSRDHCLKLKKGWNNNNAQVSSHSVCINFYNTDPLGEGYLLQDFFFSRRGRVCMARRIMWAGG